VTRLLVSVLVTALSGCSASSTRAGPPRDPAQNVLLITIDTLRADAVGAYGNKQVATPWLDRLAAGGVRFTAAHASTVVTLPSHANILSGVYPFRHGVRENAGFRFPAGTDTIATLLKARGYRTGAFVSAFPLDVRFGLTRGFDRYDDRFAKGETHAAFRVPERRGADTVAAALAWIHGGEAPPGPGDSADAIPAGERPWFAWVHLYEPHFPYAPPEPFASRFAAAPYLGEVSAADAALGPLLQPILDARGGRATLIIVTGDHGESLGEHGEMTHGLFAYEGTLRVPLIAYQPQLFRPRTIDEPVRHVDILPTILDAIGAPVPSTLDGRSFVPPAGGPASPPAATYFESLSASINRGWAPLHGVVKGTLKYIDLPIPELYDLAADPSESHDLASRRPDDVRELQRLLAGLRAAERPATPGRESADTRERLRSLGYVTGAAMAKDRYTDADDPKRLIHLDRAIEDVVSRYQRGDLRGAIGTAERIVQQRPDMPVALVHLAFLYNEAGEHRRAADTIERALAQNPAADDVAALAGAYLSESGQFDKAVKRLEPYVRRTDADIDVLIAYGVALASAGQKHEALEAFNRARAIDSGSGLPLVNIATVYLMTGEHDRAAAAFAEALAIDPALARAHNGLGVIEARRGNTAAALDHWRKAVALDPRDFETLFNIGDLLIQLGRSAEARPYWRQYLATAPPTLEAKDRERVRRWLASNPP
jgi:arylsulfatase A-like enzyme/tetratricopeptide (TPR) repeat protein